MHMLVSLSMSDRPRVCAEKAVPVKPHMETTNIDAVPRPHASKAAEVLHW